MYFDSCQLWHASDDHKLISFHKFLGIHMKFTRWTTLFHLHAIHFFLANIAKKNRSSSIQLFLTARPISNRQRTARHFTRLHSSFEFVVSSLLLVARCRFRVRSRATFAWPCSTRMRMCIYCARWKSLRICVNTNSNNSCIVCRWEPAVHT